jgi:Protein of unknown function (DUF2950)
MNPANTPTKPWPILTAIAVFILLSLGGIGCSSSTNKSSSNSAVTEQTQLKFATPDDALKAIVDAMRNHDKSQLLRILGPDGQDLISSGDQIADELAFSRFLASYDQKHSVETNDDGTVTVEVGKNDWPMPIPIVKTDDGSAWVFDTDAGKDEIINRRIGRNELDVIQVCKALCDAQREYARRDPNGDGIPEYATKCLSDPGKKNGLYWDTAEGEAPSPLGALAADAEAQGYSTTAPTDDQPRPYHGYYYRILTAQGPSAPGGAMDYYIDGKLIGGFAIVAWPADYGNSGITTFIANYSGDVYQKDLGDDTDKIARAITTYDPSDGWTKSESEKEGN